MISMTLCISQQTTSLSFVHSLAQLIQDFLLCQKFVPHVSVMHCQMVFHPVIGKIWFACLPK